MRLLLLLIGLISFGLSACAHRKRAFNAFDTSYCTPFTNQVTSPDEMTAALETRWSIEMIQLYCRETATWPDSYQNLVPQPGSIIWRGELYRDKKTGFDSIYWYGNPDRFSINVKKGRKHWVIEIGQEGDLLKGERRVLPQ